MISHAEYCVCCGEVIPEGRMVCTLCARLVSRFYGRDEKEMNRLIRDCKQDDAEDPDRYHEDCIWDYGCDDCPYYEGCASINRWW